MKIADAIELVFIAVNGGELGTDTNVQRQEIKQLLGVVISHYKKVELDEKKLEWLRNARIYMSGIQNPKFDTYYDFTVTYRIEPEYNDERAEYFVELPVSVDSAMGKIGIKNIESIKEGHPIHVAGSRAEMYGLKDVMDRYAYYEKEADGETERVYIIGLGFPVGELLLRLIPDFADIDENEAVPVSSGYHKMMIDDTVRFFREQRFINADNFVNSLDVNENAIPNNRKAGEGYSQ